MDQFYRIRLKPHKEYFTCFYLPFIGSAPTKFDYKWCSSKRGKLFSRITDAVTFCLNIKEQVSKANRAKIKDLPVFEDIVIEKYDLLKSDEEVDIVEEVKKLKEKRRIGSLGVKQEQLFAYLKASLKENF